VRGAAPARGVSAGVLPQAPPLRPSASSQARWPLGPSRQAQGAPRPGSRSRPARLARLRPRVFVSDPSLPKRSALRKTRPPRTGIRRFPFAQCDLPVLQRTGGTGLPILAPRFNPPESSAHGAKTLVWHDYGQVSAPRPGVLSPSPCFLGQSHARCLLR